MIREFMTKVSDYISERRNDPEKKGNFLTVCMLGIVVLIIIIFCLLLLWRKNANGKEEWREETFEYIPEAVMSEASNDEELQKMYLNNIQYLEKKAADLLQSLTEMQKSLEKTAITQQGDNVHLQEKINEIVEEITNIMTQLQNTQNNLYDITDMVNVMDKETIPMIQEQVSALEQQINQINADIADICNKIETLEAADAELKAKIEEVEALTAQFLRYRYDAGSNTLYLYAD